MKERKEREEEQKDDKMAGGKERWKRTPIEVKENRKM